MKQGTLTALSSDTFCASPQRRRLLGLFAGSVLTTPLSAQTIDYFAPFRTTRADPWLECLSNIREVLDTDGRKRLAEARALIMNDNLYGSYLVNAAKDKGVDLCLDNRADSYGYYMPGMMTVGLRRSMSIAVMALVMAHELRHADQRTRIKGVSFEISKQDYIRFELADEADAHAVALLVAWRLKERGHPQLWDANKYLEKFRDIPPAFEAEMKRSGDEMKATLAAFQQWYQGKDRVRTYYRKSHEDYIEGTRSRRQNWTPVSLPDDFFDRLGTLPGNRNYGPHLTPEIKTAPIDVLNPRRGPIPALKKP